MSDQAARRFEPVGEAVTYNSEMTEEKSEFVRGLYQRYWSRLNRSVKGLVHDDEVAADIAQDSFVRVNTLDTPQNLEFPYAYLFRTALNLVKDRAKAQAIRHKYRDLMAHNEQDNVEVLSPERHVMGRERLERMSQAIDQLPAKCRRVFLMHKVHHLSHKEIARMLGISQHAVEKHIMRALARCQAAFEKDL